MSCGCCAKSWLPDIGVRQLSKRFSKRYGHGLTLILRIWYFLVSHRTAKRPRLRDLFNRGELGAVQGGKEAVSPSVSISSAITI